MNKHLSLIAFGTALLAACGGGGGGDLHGSDMRAPPTNFAGSDVPIAATKDANAAFEFVASVAANKSDTADPLVVGDATLATTDTDEPKSL